MLRVTVMIPVYASNTRFSIPTIGVKISVVELILYSFTFAHSSGITPVISMRVSPLV
jgi:hypothetical protein